MKSADEIKLILLKWLLNRIEPQEAVWSELNFATGQNRADLILCSPTNLCAWEIKGPRDDFRRLSKQLIAYRGSFLEAHVVVEKDSLEAARGHLPSFVGILTIDEENEVEVKRAAKPRKGLKKENAIAWLRTSDLIRITRKFSPKQTDREHLAELASSKLSERILSQEAIASVYARIKPKFDAFIRERGRTLNSDDLRMLSMPSKVG